MLSLIRGFYSYSLIYQWLLSLLTAVFGIYIASEIFFFFAFPLDLLVIPVVKSIGHFSITPLLRISGVLNYHSPFLLSVKVKDSMWELHNGTTFDYMLNMKWSYRGSIAKNLTIKYYFNGLLNLINEIKKNENPNKIEIIGTTYFIGDKTISKIGFHEERVKFYKRILFLIDYFNLFIMFSFSRGKIAFPNIFHLRKVKISGEQLIKSEEIIAKYNRLLVNRKFLNTGKA